MTSEAGKGSSKATTSKRLSDVFTPDSWNVLSTFAKERGMQKTIRPKGYEGSHELTPYVTDRLDNRSMDNITLNNSKIYKKSNPSGDPGEVPKVKVAYFTDSTVPPLPYDLAEEKRLNEIKKKQEKKLKRRLAYSRSTPTNKLAKSASKRPVQLFQDSVPGTSQDNNLAKKFEKGKAKKPGGKEKMRAIFKRLSEGKVNEQGKVVTNSGRTVTKTFKAAESAKSMESVKHLSRRPARSVGQPREFVQKIIPFAHKRLKSLVRMLSSIDEAKGIEEDLRLINQRHSAGARVTPQKEKPKKDVKNDEVVYDPSEEPVNKSRTPISSPVSDRRTPISSPVSERRTPISSPVSERRTPKISSKKGKSKKDVKADEIVYDPSESDYQPRPSRSSAPKHKLTEVSEEEEDVDEPPEPEAEAYLPSKRKSEKKHGKSKKKRTILYKTGTVDHKIKRTDNYLYCDECDVRYKGPCPKHGPMLLVCDVEVNKGDSKNRIQTLPNFLSVCESSVANAGLGIWTEIPLQKGIVFGPFRGEFIKDPKELKKNEFAKKTMGGEDPPIFMEGPENQSANWMRYVNCACNEDRQNLVGFQYRKNIYFRTFKAVLPFTELLVWYGNYHRKDSDASVDKKGKAGSPKKKSPTVAVMPSFSSSAARSPSKRAAGRHRCDKCDYSTSNKSHIRQHILTHTGEKPYVCHVCGKGCTQVSNYKKHLLVHTGEKPHACTICGMTFNQMSNLREHSRIHTGEKPYACTECGKAFTHQAALRVHLKMHLQQKPHACPHCPYRCIRKGHMKLHVARRHTKEFELHCSVCGKGYATRLELLKHSKRMKHIPA